MAVEAGNRDKVDKILANEPNVTIFLRPIAAPAALGLAGFAGSTWITAAYIAEWYGNKDSPLILFPFVAFWGGLGQFIAGFFGYAARDTLVTVVHVLWGSFWMSVGLLYLLVVRENPTCSPSWDRFSDLTMNTCRQRVPFRLTQLTLISPNWALGWSS